MTERFAYRPAITLRDYKKESQFPLGPLPQRPTQNPGPCPRPHLTESLLPLRKVNCALALSTPLHPSVPADPMSPRSLFAPFLHVFLHPKTPLPPRSLPRFLCVRSRYCIPAEGHDLAVALRPRRISVRFETRRRCTFPTWVSASVCRRRVVDSHNTLLSG